MSLGPVMVLVMPSAVVAVIAGGGAGHRRGAGQRRRRGSPAGATAPAVFGGDGIGAVAAGRGRVSRRGHTEGTKISRVYLERPLSRGHIDLIGSAPFWPSL